MVQRFVIGVVLGAVITFALLWLMRSVIANPEAATDSGLEGHVVDFVRVQEDQELEVKNLKPKPPPPPDEPPPKLPPPISVANGDQGIDIEKVDIDIDLDLDSGGFSNDGDYLPIVKVLPIYPRRAQARGIEGYVVLQFVVTKTGAVRDPVVIEADPPSIFNRAAINAALKFKYKPKVVNGEPIEVAGVTNIVKFQLAE